MSAGLVLLPGLLCDARLFAPQFSVLSQEIAVTVAPVTTESRIEALAARLLPQLPARIALVGHCLGANVAMEILRQAPDRVDRLCLMSTTPLAETPAEAAAREPLIVKAQAGRMQDAVQGAVAPDYFASGAGRAGIVLKMQEMAMELGADVFLRQMRALQRRHDYQATLRRCKVPTLILCGAQDMLMPPRRHGFMAELMPDADFQVLDDAGHAPTLEQPEAVLLHWRSWLAAPLRLG